MPTTPLGIPFPLSTDQADVPRDIQATSEKVDQLLGERPVIQSGQINVTIPDGSNGGQATVTFPEPFASTPRLYCNIKVSGSGDSDTFFYANAGPATTTTGTVVATHRTQPLGTDTTLAVQWLAVA